MRKPRPTPVSASTATVRSPGDGEARSESLGVAPAAARTAVPVESRVENALSVAMMAGIAFLPIVIAAGFLAEHFETQSVPREVSTAALRGPIDADHHAFAIGQAVDRGSEHASIHVRAGF